MKTIKLMRSLLTIASILAASTLITSCQTLEKNGTDKSLKEARAGGDLIPITPLMIRGDNLESHSISRMTEKVN